MQLLTRATFIALLGCIALSGQLTTSLFLLSQDDPARAPASSASDSGKKSSTENTAGTTIPDSKGLEPIKIQKADYPLLAAQKQLQGEVRVKVLVSETGDVESAKVISGDPILADSALNAVRRWKFKPFIRDGKPVKIYTEVPFDFAFSDKIMEKGVSKDLSATADTPKQNTQTPAPSNSTGSTPRSVHIAAGIIQGHLIHQVAPVYPAEARRDEIQGVVVLQVVINKEGRIDDVKYISGPKQLVQSAIGAVQQWRYQPYTLNGEPVSIETLVHVNFTLRRH